MICDGTVKLSGNWQCRTMNHPAPSYHGYRSPPEIISHAVWLYHRFCLSFRDVEELLTQRGIVVSYEAIRQWCHTFGLDYARKLRRRRGPMGDTWYLDEVFVTIRGRRQYLKTLGSAIKTAECQAEQIDLELGDDRCLPRSWRECLNHPRQLGNGSCPSRAVQRGRGFVARGVRCGAERRLKKVAFYPPRLAS